MTENSKCWCGKYRSHGGNKKLAAKHSKIAKKLFEDEKQRLEALNETPIKTKVVVLPFQSAFTKTKARILL